MDKDRDQPAPPEQTKSVGYGCPPEATRFQKGRSGNPKGRPRGSLNIATAFMKALRERVIINEHGQRRKVTKLEAALKQLVNKAASGDLRALQQFLELARDAEAKQDQPSGTAALGELDREVVEGIVRRFQVTEGSSEEIVQEEKNDDQSR